MAKASLLSMTPGCSFLIRDAAIPFNSFSIWFRNWDSGILFEPRRLLSITVWLNLSLGDEGNRLKRDGSIVPISKRLKPWA